jgi:hypothetical protein
MTTLWRITGTTLFDPVQLATGIRRHSDHAPLLSSVVQIGTAQRAYLALNGCGQCAMEHCTPGCHVELLRRTLAGSSDLRLIPIQAGLAPRPYTRMIVARPTAQAQPLDSSILKAWPEARLTLLWGGRFSLRAKHSIPVVAVLRAGAEGPVLEERITALGWKPVGWATSLLRNYQPAALFTIPRFSIGYSYPHDPLLLLPVVIEPSSSIAAVPVAPVSEPELGVELGSASLSEPILKPVSEPVQEPVPEPIGEPVPEPVPEPMFRVMQSPIAAAVVVPDAHELPHRVITHMTDAPPRPSTPTVPALILPVRRIRRASYTARLRYGTILSAEANVHTIGVRVGVVPEPGNSVASIVQVTATPQETLQPTPHDAEVIVDQDEAGVMTSDAFHDDSSMLPSALHTAEEVPEQKGAETAHSDDMAVFTVAEPVVEVIEPQDAMTVIWPNGPGTGRGALTGDHIQRFFEHLLAPESGYHDPQNPGITAKRATVILGDRLNHHMRPFMVWLEQADLLERPADAAYPWKYGRRFVTDHLPTIAQHLSRTPWPSGDDIVAAKKQGL